MVVDTANLNSRLWAPLGLLGAAYYLLPGAYEWEPGQAREMLSVALLPLDAIVAFSLATGRLSPWIGHSLTGVVMAWALLGVFVLATTWGNLLRVGMASVPTVALLGGPFSSALQQGHVPVWLAWTLVTSLSLVLAAREYVFGFLPALAICWLITSLS